MFNVKKIRSSSFWNGIITLTSGAIFAQALTIIISPLLTRIFSPEEMGVYTLVITAESLFGSIIAGRYDVSIVSEANNKKVYALIKLSSIIIIISSILASLGYGYTYFISDTEYSNYTYLIFFIFFMLVLQGILRIGESYNNRFQNYKIMNSANVGKSVIQNLLFVLLGGFKFGIFGLLISHMSGVIFAALRQISTLKRKFSDIYSIDNQSVVKVMKDNYKQPIFSAPAIFANRFSYSSINLFIESLFGLEILGYYSISFKVLGLPLTILSNNIAKVFYQEASSEYVKKGTFKSSFLKTSGLLGVLAIPMVLAMYYIVPPLFEIIFGEGWSQSALFIQILSPMFGIRFIVNTISYGLQVVNKQHIELLLQFLFIIASLSIYFYASINTLDAVKYLQMISILYSIIYMIYFLVVGFFAFEKQNYTT